MFKVKNFQKPEDVRKILAWLKKEIYTHRRVALLNQPNNLVEISLVSKTLVKLWSWYVGIPNILNRTFNPDVRLTTGFLIFPSALHRATRQMITSATKLLTVFNSFKFTFLNIICYFLALFSVSTKTNNKLNRKGVLFAENRHDGACNMIMMCFVLRVWID